MITDELELVAPAAAAGRIPDGASVAIGRPPALGLVRELIRQGRRDLDLVGVPTGDIAVELLVAAGCARSLHTSGVDLGELGQAPAFARAVEEGRLRIIDSTCPAMLMALQAGASGIPWTPVPGLVGSDLLARRPDIAVVDDPLGPGRRVVLVPALAPRFVVVHARRADPAGNAVIETTFDDRLLIQASGTVIMSVDEVAPGATDTLAGGEQLIPAAYIDVMTVLPHEDAGAAAAAYLESISVHG
jgi:glutaconate CoA-transferase subunit A